MCGKTNIAEAVSSVTHVPVYKSGREHDLFHDPLANYHTLKYANYELIRMLDITGASVMFDRFFPSEWVYSQVFGRASDLSLVLEYDKYWSSLGGKIVFFDKPEMDGEDELIPSNRYNEIRSLYQEYMKLTSCDFMYLDTSDKNLGNQVRQTVRFIMGE